MRAAFCSAGVLLQKKKKERKKLPAKIRNGFGKVGYTHLTSRTCSCWKGPWAAIKLCPAVCLHAKLFECMFVCVWSYLWFTPHHACPVLACDYACCWLRFGLCWVSGRLQASFPPPRVPPPPPCCQLMFIMQQVCVLAQSLRLWVTSQLPYSAVLWRETTEKMFSGTNCFMWTSLSG